jgi:hypothetical protein
MFAPRPELVAFEMLRVCVPGGKIIMGNWTPEGHIGQMFKVMGNTRRRLRISPRHSSGVMRRHVASASAPA